MKQPLNRVNGEKLYIVTEMLVYTWGEGKRGQLGHGDAEPWRQHPESVEALRGKSINRYVIHF